MRQRMASGPPVALVPLFEANWVSEDLAGMPCSKLLQNLVFVFRSHPCKITKRCKPFQTLRSKYDFKAFKSIQKQGGIFFCSFQQLCFNECEAPPLDWFGAYRCITIPTNLLLEVFSSVLVMCTVVSLNEWQRLVRLAVFGGIFCTSGHFEMFEHHRSSDQPCYVQWSCLFLFFFAQFVAASIRCAQCCLIFRESNHNLPHGRTCLLGQLPPVDGHFCTNMHKHYFILFFQYPIRLFFLFRFGHRLLSKKFSRLWLLWPVTRLAGPAERAAAVVSRSLSKRSQSMALLLQKTEKVSTVKRLWNFKRSATFL